MAFPFHVCIAIACTAESGSRKSRSVALLLPLQSVDAKLAVGESKLCLILKEIYWLVVTGTCFMFPYIGKFIIPIDELILFRGIETTTQFRIPPQSLPKEA